MKIDMTTDMQKYLEDWNDACVYARECFPDVSVPFWHEPWSVLISLFSVSALLALVDHWINRKWQ